MINAAKIIEVKRASAGMKINIATTTATSMAAIPVNPIMESILSII